MREYYVYILTNGSGTLYTGVTNNIWRRVFEHKHKPKTGFAARYNVDRLIHLEVFTDIRDAIAREKQIKGWLRRKKINLINAANPEWADLSVGWFA